jgi:predicted dinucleotide-binding enzyme
MKIAVYGTGVVGQTVGGRLAELGHQVVFGTRDPSATRARTEPDHFGIPPFGVWLGERPGIELATFADAAGAADLVFNATNGYGSLPAMSAAGADNLGNKVIVDISNPLDLSNGFPPSLFVKDTDSLAEQIQRGFPDALVAKTLNTVTASVMVNPGSVGDGTTTIFVASDHQAARQVAVDLLGSLGWQDIVEFDDLSAARGLEMWLPLWVRLMAKLGTAEFNLKIVR